MSVDIICTQTRVMTNNKRSILYTRNTLKKNKIWQDGVATFNCKMQLLELFDMNKVLIARYAYIVVSLTLFIV